MNITLNREIEELRTEQDNRKKKRSVEGVEARKKRNRQSEKQWEGRMEENRA